VFNHGNHARDFTYVDDIVEGVVRVADTPATPDPDWSGDAPDPATSSAPYRIYNIGNNRPVKLMDYIGEIEKVLGRKAEIEFLPMQAGDVAETYADIDALEAAVGFRPATPISVGIPRFIEWYRSSNVV
jgi:UDP-glucuronate 4-epimerase